MRHRPFSRRTCLLLVAAVGWLGGSAWSPTPAAALADLVLLGGRVYTVDADRP